jgi:streptomycin 6-kinase
MEQAAKGRSSRVYAIGTDPVRMRAILEHHLQVPGGPSFEVVDCRPSFTRGREARSLFQYDVKLRDADGREWNELVSGVAYGGQRTGKVWEKLKPADEDGPGELSIRRVAYVPDLDLILQVFPFDHGLPALEPLMAGTLAGLAAPIMGRFGSGDWQLDQWQSESVRYRVDLRASVRLTVRARESHSGSVSERRFFAKVYGGRDQAERAWTVQQDLAVAVRAASAPFGLAPLVAYLPDARVLVQDEVQALSLPHIIRRADPETVAEAVRRAARAIAALHRLSITAPEHRLELDRTDPARLRRTADILRNSRPDLAGVVAEIERQINDGLDAIGRLPAVPIHGDLKPAHVLLEEERVVLIDLDKFAAGEPMLDVTNLLMPLRRERKTRLAGTSLARVFAKEYFAHVPPAWEQRLAPLYAWAVLSEATAFAASPRKNLPDVKNNRPQRREQRVDVLVEEARAMLAGEA